MKIKLLIAVAASVLMAITGTAIAGPGDKGKNEVIIQHTPPSDKGKGVAIENGSVELAVSYAGAIAHLANHDDCVVFPLDIFDPEDVSFCGGEDDDPEPPQ